MTITDINMILNYKDAKNKLLNTNIKGCRKFFASNGFIIEQAYLELLEGDAEKAHEVFMSTAQYDTRADWALAMISFIFGRVDKPPSYFQIRNFLEIDLNLLIKYFKGDYVEKILRYSDYMFYINPEVYKFIGRVFWFNDLKQQSVFFLNKGKNCFFNDPELHYLLAAAYLDNYDFENAHKALNNCLYVLPDYYPALNLLKKLNKVN